MPRVTQSARASAKAAAVPVVALAVLLASLGLLWRAAALVPAFDPNVRVDDGPGPVDTPKIAATAGALHVAWNDYRAGELDIYYARSLNGGLTWTASVPIDQAPSGYWVEWMDLAANQSGSEVYLAYVDSRNGSPDLFVRASLDGGVTWSPSVRVDDAAPGYQAMHPAIAVDATGAVHVVWEDDRTPASPFQVYHARSTDKGASWSANLPVSATPAGSLVYAPSLAAAGNGELHAVWRQFQGGPDSIVSGNSADGGQTWSRSPIVTGAGGESLTVPDVAAAPAGGRVHATWVARRASGETEVLSAGSIDAGATWSAASRVDDVPTGYVGAAHDGPSITLLLGSPFVVWNDRRSTLSDLYATGSSDYGATWGDCPVPCWPNNDARVDDSVVVDAQQHASSVPDASGTGVFVAWDDDRSGVAHVYFSRYSVSEVLLTEFRDAPDGSGEVIEIMNFGGLAVDFLGYTLEVDGIVFPLDALGTVPAMQYRTVGNWPASSLKPVGFSLGDATLNQAGTIALRDAIGTLLDEVRYGYYGSAPDPLNSASVSTARHFAGAGYADEWALDLTATFNAPNDGGRVASAPALILNEVLYDTADPTDHFIELYYTGTTSLNTTGYRIVGNSVWTIPASAGVTLDPANPYALVFNLDNPFLFSLLAPGGDNLYLYDSGWNLLDEVGWSSTHAPETSVCRVPDGYGTYQGYDDTYSVIAGWQFGCTPTPAVTTIAPDATVVACNGDALRYDLAVTNRGKLTDTVDITVQPGINGWPVYLNDSSGAAPLQDTDGDGTPDTGPVAPLATADVVVTLLVPSWPSLDVGETVNLTARSSLNSYGVDAATLAAQIHPCLGTSKLLVPGTIPVGTGVATLTLQVEGRGPVPPSQSADIVLLIDSSGSMTSNDPANDRLTSAKSFIDLLQSPARVSILDFDEDCVFTPGQFSGIGHHLNSFGHDGVPDYNDPKADVDTIDSNGGTDILCAIREGNNELITLGIPSHRWIEILLTDGQGGDPALIRAEAANAGAAGITIFTIGLGAGQDASLLQDVANLTGGKYYNAANASNLADIFAEIGSLIDLTAGEDPYPATFIPMIREVLPPYIQVVPGTFVLGSLNNRETDPVPDWPPVLPPAGGVLEWNVTRMILDDIWSVAFQVRCLQGGTQPVEVYPDSQVNFLDFDGVLRTTPFPARDIVCTTPPPPLLPPTHVATTWDGGLGAGLTWVEPPVLPDRYLIYKVAGDPRAFPGFSPAAAYAVVPAPASSWSDPAPLPSAGGAEYYYLLRSADASLSDVSPTSNTAGLFVGTLNAGLTAISRPLEYFPWVDYSGGELDTVGEYRGAFGASAMQYLDSGGRWSSADPATPVAVGDAYLVGRATPGIFVFTGLPGSMIAFDEGAFGGFALAPTATALSLAASAAGVDVTLSWAAAAGMGPGDLYQVWSSPTRTGFFDGTATLAATVLHPATTHTRVGALATADEAYFWVVPVDDALGPGTSTYSVGVWAKTLAGHDTLALPLKPGAPLSIAALADSIPGALGLLWLTAAGIWVPHFAAMAAGTYDAAVLFGLGYQVSVRSAVAVRVVFVGR
jgi:hypothetical protein